MNNFTDKQILEIVKRYSQHDECVLDGEEEWCCEHIDYISSETDVEDRYVSYSVETDVEGGYTSYSIVYEVKGEKNKYVAVKTVITNTGYWGDSDLVSIDAYFVVPKEVTKIVYVKESND